MNKPYQDPTEKKTSMPKSKACQNATTKAD